MWKATDITEMTGTDAETVCAGDHMAYLGEKDGSNYVCIDAFDLPKFAAIPNPDTESEDKFIGFQLKYNSTESGRIVTIDALCDKNAVAGEGTFSDITVAG